MKRTLLTASLLAAIAAPVFAQQASQLAQTLEHQLAAEGIYDIDVHALDLAQQAAIKSVLDTGDANVAVRSQVWAIVN